MKPLLLVDVDGVLNPTGRSVPPGFERHETDAFNVLIKPEHGVWLRELAEHFELVWATTWAESAGQIFGELLELPSMEIIHLDRHGGEGTWKLRDVRAFVGDRACAWIDDEIYDDAEQWAAERSPSTLLVRTSGTIGFTHEHFENLTAFARGLSHL